MCVCDGGQQHGDLPLLTTADGQAYTELGYDFANQSFYVDHSRCCAPPNTIVQRAPLPSARLGAQLEMTGLVDGGLIEAFLGGRVITALVAPDAALAPPDERVTTIVDALSDGPISDGPISNSTAGRGASLSCSIDTWQLAL